MCESVRQKLGHTAGLSWFMGRLGRAACTKTLDFRLGPARNESNVHIR